MAEQEQIGIPSRFVKALKCSCEHKYQDERYGKGKRLHNMKSNGNWTCTVCRSERAA